MNRKNLLQRFVPLTLFILLSFFGQAQILTEGFESTTFPPAGWLNVHLAGPTATALWDRSTTGANGGDDPDFNAFVVNPHTGAGAARFRAYNFSAGNSAILVSPAFSLTTGAPHIVSFWMHRDDGYDTNIDSLSIAINTAPNATGAVSLGTIVRIISENPAETGIRGWFKYTFNIPAIFNTATNYIVLTATSDFGNNIFIDDLIVENLPSCFPTASVTTNNITTSGVTINWAAVTGASGGYQYAVTTSATPPASGAATTGLTATIGSLSAGTTYYAYVRTNCGANGFSTWASIPFSTLCSSVDVPYLEDFETVVATELPSCFVLQDLNANTTWTGFVNTGTPPVTTASSGTKSIRYNWNTPAAADDWFFIRGVNLIAGTSYRVQFKYKGSDGPDFIEKLEVKYGTSPEAAAMNSPLFSNDNIISALADPFQTGMADFTPATSGTYYIGFHAFSDADMAFIYVDDINVIETPGCESPIVTVSELSSSSALISWPAVTGANSYEYVLNNVATAPTGAGTSVGTSLSVTASGLSGGTLYYAHVRTICGSGNSTWENVPFTTLLANDSVCNAINLTLDGPQDCKNTALATIDSDPALPNTCSSPNNTVWYKYTATADGPVAASLVAPATNNLSGWLVWFTSDGNCPAPTLTAISPECQSFGDVAGGEDVLLSPTLTSGITYYIMIDGVAGDVGEFCISLVTPPAAPNCTNLLAPANLATNVSLPPTFIWNAAANATSYDVYLSEDGGGTYDNIGNLTDTSATIWGLNASTQYFWYIVPVNAGGTAVGCDANAYSFTTAAGPANDACANAADLPVSNAFCGNPLLGNLAGADSTTNLGQVSCSTTALTFDVWYKVTVPATGNVTIQTSAVNTDVTDLLIQAYSGTCGSLVAIGCNDDGNPDAAPSALHAKLGLTGRTPGEVIYVRVVPYEVFDAGAFAICAFDTSASVLPAVALGAADACTPAVGALNIDSAYKYTWATLKDATGNIIAQIYPNGNVLGNTNASFYINSGAVRNSNGFYLDRNITITPTTQPTSPVVTRLFFKQTELAALAAVAGGATRPELNVTKTTQVCSPTIGGNGVYIAQTANAAYGADHSIDINNASFSSFYLHKGATPIPVTLLSFNVQRVGKVNSITWSTSQELNTRVFIVERSTDGISFRSIGQVNAAGSSTTVINYSFVDNAPVKGINYYRLRMVDRDNNFKNSITKSVRNEGTADISVYPNPVKDLMRIAIASDKADKGSITITDMSGKLVLVKAITLVEGLNTVPVSMSNFTNGAYIIKVQLSTDMIVKKFNKL